MYTEEHKNYTEIEHISLITMSNITLIWLTSSNGSYYFVFSVPTHEAKLLVWGPHAIIELQKKYSLKHWMLGFNFLSGNAQTKYVILLMLLFMLWKSSKGHSTETINQAKTSIKFNFLEVLAWLIVNGHQCWCAMLVSCLDAMVMCVAVWDNC